ncbi:DUF3147 family protein [Chitinibacter bivalviorum]|uniref:DUF3147 family protein n=1 Tax=Chitinibacter bivalviorum TaxID=2739434 RepID=A0A7H9BIL6_9NEIS|nr:DUF3147 family protein [Chitinibacter bivalviorum]QLG87811.1 DUF3147 family protein [Chitinibacter bivalviorum]
MASAYLITKYLITAAAVVGISEVASRYERIGGLLAALPIVTCLTLIWLYIEKQPSDKIANHAWYTFWYVVPTLPTFLAFPSLLTRFGFWPALGISVVATMALFLVYAQVLAQFQINLL